MALHNRLLQALPLYRRACPSSSYASHTVSPKACFWTSRPDLLVAQRKSLRSASHFSTADVDPSEQSRQSNISDQLGKIIYSKDQPDHIAERAALLLPTWTVIPSGKGLARTYNFKTFRQSMQFMERVAAEIHNQKHHPSWSNMYNKVTVEWTTHRPEGLSIKDVHMAEFCDRVAEEIGSKGKA